MSYAGHAVRAPAGQYDIALVQLDHPAWPTPLRFADILDEAGVTVTLPDSSTAFFAATGAGTEAAPTDDTGIDSRRVVLPDPELVLMKRIEALHYAGEDTPITATILLYLSTDLTVPVTTAVLRVAKPRCDNRRVSFEASTANILNRDGPGFRFTYANSPGLRR